MSSRTEALSSLSLRSLSSWFFWSSDLSVHGHMMADVAPGDTFSFQLPKQEGRGCHKGISFKKLSFDPVNEGPAGHSPLGVMARIGHVPISA